VLSDASFAILIAFSARLLGAHRLLLLEGNFRPGEHERALSAALPATGVDLSQVLCRADAATRAARLAARAADPSRHPGHRDAALDSSALEPGAFLDLPGPRWEFDSSKGERAWTSLCRELDRWCATAPADGPRGAQA